MQHSKITSNSIRNHDERHIDDSDEEAGVLVAQYDAEGEYIRLSSRVLSPVRLLLPFHVSHL